ncbi:MAG: hypothetical protein ABR949_01000 [Candidatus Aquilonibacter sp.]|jgi:hypothetical protein
MHHIAKAIMELVGVSTEQQSARMGHADVGVTVGVYGHLYDRAGESIAHDLDAFFTERLGKRKRA